MNPFRALLIVAVVVVPLGAQTAHVYSPGVVTMTALPTTAPAPTIPPIPAYPIPPQPLTGPPLGGHAFDQITDLVYVSSGPFIEIAPHPLYPPAVPFPPGPFPVPAVPTVPGGPPFGLVTGMAMMPGPAGVPGGILLVTDGLFIMGLTPFPPYAPIIPPFPVILPGVPMAPLTGLEFDPFMGSIWACDIAGVSYNIAIGGGLIAGPIPPPIPPAGPTTGNIFDRSIPGGALYTTDGIAVYPVFGPVPPMPIPIAGPGVPIAYGASFGAEPLLLPGGCPCGPFLPVITSTTTASVGSITPFGVGIAGGVPGGLTFFGIDFAAGPPLVFPGGCTWWLPPAPFLVLGPIFLDATGSALIPFGALPPGFVGGVFYGQWVMSCPGAPAGISLTDALHVRVSLP